MEASSIPAPAGATRQKSRASLGPLLRLRSDDQLVRLFRQGNEDAFRAIHDRYRARLFAYTRQMLAGSRQDAEDALQDVFVRAYGALRADDREVSLRAWLYRVAHNRCIDELRRPAPPPPEVFEQIRPPAADPIAETEQRESLRRLVEDVRRLPEQQRSALLMREIVGMSYVDLAAALDVTVPAVKSLLVRARMGLAQAAEARDTACVQIREQLVEAHDRGVRASGLVRRHLHDCAGCRAYRRELKTMRERFAALTPALGPVALLAKLLGIGGGGAAAGGAAAGSGAGAGAGAAAGGAAAGGAAAVGGAGAAAVGGGVTAGHVAAVVAAAVVGAGGAVEVKRSLDTPKQPIREAAVVRTARARPQTTPLTSPIALHPRPSAHPAASGSGKPTAAARESAQPAALRRALRRADRAAAVQVGPPRPVRTPPATVAPGPANGGAAAPDDATLDEPTTEPTAPPTTTAPTTGATTTAPTTGGTGASGGSGATGGSGGSGATTGSGTGSGTTAPPTTAPPTTGTASGPATPAGPTTDGANAPTAPPSSATTGGAGTAPSNTTPPPR